MTTRLRPSPAPTTVSALHLTEGRDGWSLTLSLTPELIALVAEAAAGSEPARQSSPAVCRVHVQPNLLPGEPFDITEITVARLPEATSPAGERPIPTKERHA